MNTKIYFNVKLVTKLMDPNVPDANTWIDTVT